MYQKDRRVLDIYKRLKMQRQFVETAVFLNSYLPVARTLYQLIATKLLVSL